MHRYYCHKLKAHPNGKATIKMEDGTFVSIDAGGSEEETIANAVSHLASLSEKKVSVSKARFWLRTLDGLRLSDVYYVILTRKEVAAAS